jgi:hypothetical protein
MTRDPLLNAAERWFRLLLRFYPPDFRDDMGEGMVEATAPVTRSGAAACPVLSASARAPRSIRCAAVRASGRARRRRGDGAAPGATPAWPLDGSCVRRGW